MSATPVIIEAAVPDVLLLLLEDKRSPNTRRAYAHDLRRFFEATYGAEPTQELVRAFLAQPTPLIVAQILRFKAALIAAGRSEATVNRNLSAVQSLLRYARKLGITEADASGLVEAEKVVAYRDTRGISAEQARLLLSQPDRKTLRGQRDHALLLLLLENALRRAEIVALTRADFDAERRTLNIRGKGRGTQQELVTISRATVLAIETYWSAWSLDAAFAEAADAPLFVCLSRFAYGRALTADGLYKIVRENARQAGLQNALSPHRLRHTAITMALDAAGGDIRRVQRLSRHARLETLQIYDDNRADLQGEVTNLLSQILSE